MTTTDDTALQEQIARALDPYAWERRDRWSSADSPNYPLLDNIVIVSMQQAAAALPIIRAEVAKARAEAWDEGQKSGLRYADRAIRAHEIGRPDLPGPPSPNPYRTEQNDGR